VVVGN